MKRPAKPAPPRNPTRTREAILATALDEFARNGFAGGRVDAIALAARANKRMIYHYFASKEGLYRAVLERVYGAKREAERALALDHLAPADAIEALVAFNFDYCRDHPELVRLLGDENQAGARRLKLSRKVRELYSPLVAVLRAVLARGVAEDAFRAGVDPVRLYVTIAGLAYFYFGNNATLSTIFARKLASRAEIDAYRAHAVAVVLGFLARPVVR